MVDQPHGNRPRSRQIGSALALIVALFVFAAALIVTVLAMWAAAPESRMFLFVQGVLAALVLAGIGAYGALRLSRAFTVPLDSLAFAIDAQLSGDAIQGKTLPVPEDTPNGSPGRADKSRLGELAASVLFPQAHAEGIYAEQERLITAVTHMSHEMTQLDAQRSAIVNFSPDPVLTLDREGRILNVNDAARRVFRSDLPTVTEGGGDEAVTLAQLLSPGWEKKIRSDLAQFKRVGYGQWIGQRFEAEALRGDGTPFPAEIVITPTVPSSSPDYGKTFLLILRDIEPQRSAQVALRQGRASLMAVIENTGDGIGSIDRHGHVLVANSVFKRLLRETYAVDLDRNPDAFTQELPHALHSLWSRTGALALEGARLIKELHYSLPSGSITLETAFNPIVGADGRVQGVSIFVRDITGHKRVQALLRYRSQLQQTLARISTEFINLEPSYTDQSVLDALAELGAMARVDRSYVLQFRHDGSNLLDSTHEWCASGVPSIRERLQGMPRQLFPWWNETMRQDGKVSIHRMDELPAEAALEREMFISQGTKSLLAVPMRVQGRIVGVVGFEGVKRNIDWEDDSVTLLRLLADIFVSAFQRQEAEAILADQHAFLARRVEERTAELQIRYRREAALASIEPNIGRPDELKEVLTRVAEVAAEMLEMAGAAVLLWAADSESFVGEVNAVTLPEAESLVQHVRGTSAIARWIVNERQPLIVSDLLDPNVLDDLPEAPDPSLVEDGMAAFAGVPLLAKDEVLGVLYVLHNAARPFSQSDRGFLSALANRAALAVSNLRLYETLQQANLELARAARLKDDFLASMSHELRTPLNAILGMAESLQEEIYGELDPDQHYPMGVIQESGRHLLALINDILDLSRIEAGQADLFVEPVNVDAICQASMQFVRQSAKSKRINVHLDIASQDARVGEPIWADQRRLKQILVNLLSNAVKFTPEGGDVGMTVVRSDAGDSIQFVVWDTGIGIAKHQLNQLFQPFAQLDSSLNRRYSGTGLGLALVYRMVSMHGGSVGVESEPGQGSRFNVMLPSRPLQADQYDDDFMRGGGSARNALGKPSLRPGGGASQSPQWDFDEGTTPSSSKQGGSDASAPPRPVDRGNGTFRPELPSVARFNQYDRPGSNGINISSPRGRNGSTKSADLLGSASPRETRRMRSIPLPPVSLPPAPPLVEQNGAAPQQVRHPKVLLVEDNLANVKVVKEYLERQGCQVLCAYDGQEGLAMAASVAPSIILMDIQMPGMDGMTAIQRLRAEERYNDVPILALTALAMPGDKERILAAGANQYMSKPISLVALYRAIQTHLKMIS